MAISTRQPARHHRQRSVLHRTVVAVSVWLVVLSGLLVFAPRGVAVPTRVEALWMHAPPTQHPWTQDQETQDQGTQAPWSWPLQPAPALDRPFERPATRYAAGHRGVDLVGAAGQPVLAVAGGVVTHSGMVAGRGTVTVLHPGGIASTYEPVEDRITTGAAVTRGMALGRIGSGGHCSVNGCLHLGARLGEEYLDPLLLLARARIVLLPLLTPDAPPSGAS